MRKKCYALLIILQTAAWAIPSNYFTPFKATNEGAEILAFPYDQAGEVLRRILAAPRLEYRIEIKEKTITNVQFQDVLRIQYVTNNAEIKKEQFVGRIVGGIVGGLALGLTCGIVFASPLQTSSVYTLGIGLGVAGLSFGIGVVIDIGRDWKISFLLKK